MRHLTRRAAAVVAVCLAVAVPATAAFADAGDGTANAPAAGSSVGSATGPTAGASVGGSGSSVVATAPSTTVTLDNSAVSVDTTSGTSVFHLAFTVVRSSGPAVSVSNVALAVTSCSNCTSVAIAIQVDLVWPVPTTLTASNIAVAVTSGCTTCDAIAAAFQYVIATNQPVVLTRLGRHEVKQIEHELRDLRGSGLSPSDLAARINSLAAELGDVLATQLVPAPADQGGGDDGRGDGATLADGHDHAGPTLSGDDGQRDD